MKQAMPGWEEGIALMKAGGKSRFIIPYQLAYGENGYGTVPPKTAVVVDIELLDVK